MPPNIPRLQRINTSKYLCGNFWFLNIDKQLEVFLKHCAWETKYSCRSHQAPRLTSLDLTQRKRKADQEGQDVD
jgi:hypothetical protein